MDCFSVKFHSNVLLLILMIHSYECFNSNCTEPCDEAVLSEIASAWNFNFSAACKTKVLEICCESDCPIIYSAYRKLYVREIHYKTPRNFRVRVSDDSLLLNDGRFNCTALLSSQYLSPNDFYFFESYGAKAVNFLNCRDSVITPKQYGLLVYSDPFFCSVGSESEYPYWYATSERLTVEKMPNSCRWITKIRTSANVSKKSISLSDVQDYVIYGYELITDDTNIPLIVRILESIVSIYFVKFLFYTTWPYFAMRLCIVIPLLLVLVVFRCKRRHASIFEDIEAFLTSFDELKPIRYSYSDIRKMTGGFKETIGKGGFGTVYKAKLRNGHYAAVKMLNRDKSDSVKNFMSEVAAIGRARHVNVVRLIGYCVDGSKRALVYEFMANGSLDRHIFSQEDGSVVSAETMHEIALGIARGMEYLHNGCQMRILHFDIKPHNILLDDSFCPKVGDFGLAKLFPTEKSVVSLTAVRGTLGYMAPEFFYSSIGGVSHKADVYSYGKMVLEMAARKRDSSSASDDHSSQIFLSSWVYNRLVGGGASEEDSCDYRENNVIKKLGIIGLWCMQTNPCDRPSMRKVVEMLQMDVELIELPPKPSFFPRSSCPLEDETTSSPLEVVFTS